jgi:hypothetical protein
VAGRAYIFTHLRPEMVTRPLREVEEQVPFAMALGLTGLAKQAMNTVRSNMPQHFDIGSAWVLRGVVFEKARKTDYPFPASEVGVRHDRGFLEKQLETGPKTPEGGRSSFSIPIAGSIRSKRAPARAGSASSPGAVRQRKTALLSTDRMRAGSLGLFSGARSLRLQWVFRRSITIRKAWPFFDDVQGAVRIYWDSEMRHALDRAMKTVKAGRGGRR